MDQIKWKDQYKHPNWQRKRAESLESAGYKCQRCGDTETQLHVHHKRYVKGRLIWEYENHELQVLCEPCHEQSHAEKDAFQEFIAMLPSQAIPEILGLILGYCEEMPPPISAYGDIKQFEYADSAAQGVGFMAALAFKRGGTELIHELTTQLMFGVVDGVMTIKVPERNHG